MATNRDASADGFFLDTSTQISRHWELPGFQQRIRADLQGKALFCCGYVRQQYKATLLNALIVLHNLVQNSSDPLEAMERSERREQLRRAQGRGTPGEAHRVRQAGHRLLRMFPNRFATKEEVLDRLRRMIEEDWEGLFQDQVILPLVDETGCQRATGAPLLNDIGYYDPVDSTCNLHDPRACGIRAFWTDHGLDLAALASATVDDLPEGKPRDTLATARNEAERILSGESPQGRRCSVRLSDCIIALESRATPRPSTVHTTDRDFEPICERFNVPVRILPETETAD